MKTIQPSLLAFNLNIIDQQLQACTYLGIQAIHYDVMDALYVNNYAFDTTYIQTIHDHGLKVFVHLMTKNIVEHVKTYLQQPVHAIVIHPDADLPDQVDLALDLINRNHPNVHAGIALRNRYDPSNFLPWLKRVKYVVVMGVIPGAGGQKYMAVTNRQLTKLQTLIFKHKLDLEVILDGGVTPEVIIQTKQYVNHFVTGSFLMQSADLSLTYAQLNSSLNEK